MPKSRSATLTVSPSPRRRVLWPRSARLLLPPLLGLSATAGCTGGEPRDASQPAATAADLILEGGTIYTLRDDQPSPVEALAVRDGEVIFAGAREQAHRLRGSATRTVDLAGGWAMPGLVDAHAHLFNLGALLVQADLRGTRSAQDCVERAAVAAQQLAPGEWLLGRGWDQNDWADTSYPDRRLLDAAFGDRPVYLRRVDGHAGWANSAALALGGIGAQTPDPPGGEILRDAHSAEPTGILIDAADDSLRARIPRPGDDELDRRIAAATLAAARAGLTGVHEMGVTLQQLRALERAQQEGRLAVRVVALLGGGEVLREFAGGPRRPPPRERLRVDGVKLYADGALGSRGAALVQDYSDRPGHRGLLVTTPDALRAQSAEALARGFSVAIHAIGDRGNRVALDALQSGYDDARGQNPQLPPLRELRARVEHAQVLAPEDLPRFALLGVLPSMQPTHCTSDMPWAPQRLGATRIGGAYAWRRLRETGCILPLGSDFPVEEVSPLLGLYAARTRRPPPDSPLAAQAPGQGWSPEQCLTPLEALCGFTSWAAQAAGVPQWGRLVEGCRADVTVLDVDPLADDDAVLLRARATMTLVDGAVTVHAPEVR